MRDGTTRWEWLEEHSATLFLVAGAVLVAYGASNGIEAFTNVTLPPSPLFFGFSFAFLGLLGLYPTLAAERPRLAMVGAGTATVGLVGVCLATLRSVGHLVGVLPEFPPGWSVIVIFVLVGFIGGYLAFGLAALRSEGHSTTVGLFLLIPGLIVVLMLLHMAAGLEQPWSVFVVSSGQAMAHLAIGATLHQQSPRPEGDEQTDETAARATTDD